MNHNEISSLAHPTEQGVIASGPPPYEMRPVYTAQYQPQESEEDFFISPKFVLRVILQWWYIAGPIGLALAILSGAIVMLTFTPVYRSSAVLKIASYTPYIAYTLNEQPVKPEEFTETQIELLQSRLVMEQLVTRDEIAGLREIQEQDNPISWLASAVKVDQVGNSELYNVFLDTTDPESSALLVNAVLDEYFAVRRREEDSQTQRVIELLNKEKDDRSKEIQNLQEKLRLLARDVPNADPFSGDTDVLAPLKELGDRWHQAEVDRKMLEMQIAAIDETMSHEDIEVGDVELEMAISETQEISDLRALIAIKKLNLHNTENVAAGGKDDPTYGRLKRELDLLERSLANAANSARPQIADQLKVMAVLDNRDVLKQLKAELALKRNLEELLEERYQTMRAETNKSGDLLLEIQFTRQELDREQKVFEKIAERSMALTTESRAPGRVALLRRGEAPAGPVESLPLRSLAAAVVLSGCLPFGLALLWEMSVRRISDADQLSHHSQLPVVGEVSKLPMRARTLTPGGGKAMRLFEESIDSFRVSLILPDRNHDVKVVAVASAVHNEGKSSISSQLAVSIGRSIEEPVLLIDGDLRSPDIHHIFDIPNKVGLADVLEGTASLEDAIVTTWSETVHLLPAGRLKKSPHKLMSIGLLESMLKELRDRYRYIVIDTPPILSAAESLMLAKVADGTVLSTRRNVSREHQVQTAYERLVKAGARPMGAVFNGVPTRHYARNYGNYEYTQSFD